MAVRYPRGGDGPYTKAGGPALVREGSDLTLVSYGILVNEAIAAADLLREQGIRAELIKLDRISPLDMGPIVDSASRTGALFVVEDCADRGCLAREIFSDLAQDGISVRCFARNLGDRFIPHGSVADLYRACGIDGESLATWITEALGHG